jgi:hypothetical protein
MSEQQLIEQVSQLSIAPKHRHVVIDALNFLNWFLPATSRKLSAAAAEREKSAPERSGGTKKAHGWMAWLCHFAWVAGMRNFVTFLIWNGF